MNASFCYFEKLGQLFTLFQHACIGLLAIQNTANFPAKSSQKQTQRAPFSLRLPLLIASTALLAACAGPSKTNPGGLPDATQSAPMQAARAYEQRAVQAFARGESASALADYRNAAKLYASLAAVDAHLRAQLNVARVQAESGDAAAGMATVDEVLARVASMDTLGGGTLGPTSGPTSISPDTRLLAYGRAAALRLTPDASSAQLLIARQHLSRASTLCGQSSPQACPQSAALYVLQARAALLARDPARAHAAATAALQAQPSSAEQANALRMRAYATLASPASPAYPAALTQAWADAQIALRLDQALGLAPRVADDLRALVTLARLRQQLDWATHYQGLLDQTGAQSAASRRTLPFSLLPPPPTDQSTFGPTAVTPF